MMRRGAGPAEGLLGDEQAALIDRILTKTRGHHAQSPSRQFESGAINVVERSIEVIIERLDAHDKRLDAGERRFEELIRCSEENTKAVNSLVDETRDILKLYRDLMGARDVATSLQRAGLWCLKWGAIFGGFVAAIKIWAGHE